MEQKQQEDTQRGRGQGQSPAGEDDTTSQAKRGSQASTSAQRSGGQTDGGQGMGNESFEGSSLGGQAGSPDPAAAMFNGEPSGDASQNYIDPTTGQSNEQGFARDGQGAADAGMESAGEDGNPAPASDLDGE